nr:MAG TPA: endopeptidase tail [Caudoviricetes sp.]
MARTHPQYSNLQKMSTCITVEQSDFDANGNESTPKEIWRGRVLSHEADWYNRRAVYCEGALSYFNDSAITPFNYEGKLAQFLQHLISAHNQQCGEMRMKRFELGTVTAALGDLVVHYGDMDAYGVGEDYGSTWDIIDKMVLKVYGGYAYCTYNPATGNNVLNYCDQAFEADRLVNQTIEYGVNLLDFTEKTDINSMFTRVYPTGNKHTVTRTEWVWKFLWWGKKTEVADHEERYSIRNTSSAAIQKYLPSGYSYSLYQEDGDCNWIQNDAAVKKFGVISKVADYDADSADDLFGAAVQDLQKNSLMTMSYTIKAVDLVDAGYDKDRLTFASYAHIISKPHSIDVVMLCTKLVEPLDDPSKKEFTFGMTRQTLTDRQVANLGKTNLLEEQTSTSEKYSGNIYDWVTKYKKTNDEAVKKVGEQATEAAKTATNYLSFDKTNGLRVGHESLSGKYVQISNNGIIVTDGSSKVNIKSGSISITDGNGSCTISSGQITFYGVRNTLIRSFKDVADGQLVFSGTYTDIPINAQNCNYVMLTYESYATKTSHGWFSSKTETYRAGGSSIILPVNGEAMAIIFPWDTMHRRNVAVFKDKIRFWDGYMRYVQFDIDTNGTDAFFRPQCDKYTTLQSGEDNWEYKSNVCVPLQLYAFM